MSFSLTSENQSEPLNISSTTAISSSVILMEENPKPEIPESDGNLYFILVPLAAFITIIFLSAMVYLMARTKPIFMTNIYNTLHTPSRCTIDVSDNEEQDDDDPTECLLAGKLQIENRYDSYQIQSYNSQRELYT